MRINDAMVLFADLQPFLVSSSKTLSPKRLALGAATMARIAEVLELPVIFSIVPEQDHPEPVIPELSAFSTAKNTLSRVPTDAFLDGPTVAAIEASGRKTLAISGFASEIVILNTALSAIAAGYLVHVLTDAVGGVSERTESAAFRQIERAGGTISSVLSFASRLAPDFKNSPGSEVMKCLWPLFKPED